MQSRDNFDCVIVELWLIAFRSVLRDNFNWIASIASTSSVQPLMPEKSNAATVELWFLTSVQYSHHQQRDCLTNSTVLFLPSPCTASFQALSVNAFRWRIRDERPGDA